MLVQDRNREESKVLNDRILSCLQPAASLRRLLETRPLRQSKQERKVCQP